jgi:hypothetical protein
MAWVPSGFKFQVSGFKKDYHSSASRANGRRPAANANGQNIARCFGIVTHTGALEKNAGQGFLTTFLPNRLQLSEIFTT